MICFRPWPNSPVRRFYRDLKHSEIQSHTTGQGQAADTRDVEAVIEASKVRLSQDIRSDNGLEFVSKAVKKWLEKSGVETLYITPGSPWENLYVVSFNNRLRDELLNRELFLSIDELRYVADRWRMDYNHYGPHSSLNYMAPAAFAAICLEQGSGSQTTRLSLRYSHKGWYRERGHLTYSSHDQSGGVCKRKEVIE